MYHIHVEKTCVCVGHLAPVTLFLLKKTHGTENGTQNTADPLALFLPFSNLQTDQKRFFKDMGAVHGVHLKYVAMSIGCVQTARSIDSEARFIAWSAFWYCAILHALIAACFVLRIGMPLIGKSAKTGQVPWWSYVIFWGFHLPTWLYTDLHTRHSVSTGTPVATEVVPGWWIGGRFGDRLKKKWAVTIDLTCEFPEACREVTGPSALPPPPASPTRCQAPYRLRLHARQPPVCPNHSALLYPTGHLPGWPPPH